MKSEFMCSLLASKVLEIVVCIDERGSTGLCEHCVVIFTYTSTCVRLFKLLANVFIYFLPLSWLQGLLSASISYKSMLSNISPRFQRLLTVTDCNQPRGPARPGSSGTNDTVVWSELRVVFAEVRITKRNVQQ